MYKTNYFLGLALSLAFMQSNAAEQSQVEQKKESAHKKISEYRSRLNALSIEVIRDQTTGKTRITPEFDPQELSLVGDGIIFQSAWQRAHEFVVNHVKALKKDFLAYEKQGWDAEKDRIAVGNVLWALEQMRTKTARSYEKQLDYDEYKWPKLSTAICVNREFDGLSGIHHALHVNSTTMAVLQKRGFINANKEFEFLYAHALAHTFPKQIIRRTVRYEYCFWGLDE